MKKIYASIVMLLMASAACAQRTIELQIEVVSPADGSTLTAGDAFVQHTIFTVIGPDSIAVGDTLVVIDPFTSQTSQGYLFTNYGGKVPGGDDTINLFRNYSLQAASTGQGNYCVSAFVMNAADPIIDSIYSGCNVLNYVGNTSSVKFVETTDGIGVFTGMFPNPANAEANFEVKLNGTAAVAVKVVDLAGRVVLNADQGNLTKGTHKITVNTTGIAPGLYLYQVTIGGHAETGKLYITR